MIDVKKLKGKMVEMGVTQKDLATKIGMSTNSLNNKINGKRAFNTEEICHICEMLQISDDVLKAQIFLR